MGRVAQLPGLKKTFLDPGLGTEVPLVARSILVIIPDKYTNVVINYEYDCTSCVDLG